MRGVDILRLAVRGAIHILPPDLLGSDRTSETMTQFVCDLLDGVLQRKVRLHLPKGSHGGEAGFVSVIYGTSGTKRRHVVCAIRHHHASFDDAERAIVCCAPFGI